MAVAAVKEERNAEVHAQFAAGLSQTTIARLHGISRNRVGQILRDWRPRPDPPPPVEVVEERPMWSRPDPITLRIVREARAEMERNKM